MTRPEEPSTEVPIDRSGADDGAVRTPLSQDDRLRVLQHRRRRIVLRALLESDDSIAVRSLAGRIADLEDEPTVGTATVRRHQRVHVSLVQVHLPLLDEYGVVEYDREWGRVERGDTLSAFEPYLRAGLFDGSP